MGVQIGTIMLAVTALAALAGALIGAIAAWRSRDYHEEQAQLLLLLGHHCLEPTITLGLVATLALPLGNGGSVVLAIASLLSIFAPWCFRSWKTRWLRSHNQALRWWALARFCTCALVWISLATAGDLGGRGEAPMLGVTTVIGTLALWGSLLHSALILRNFPAVDQSLGAVGSEAG